MLEAAPDVKYAAKRPTAKRHRWFIAERRTKLARWFGMDVEWRELARHPRINSARFEVELALSRAFAWLYDYRVRRSDIKIERVR